MTEIEEQKKVLKELISVIDLNLLDLLINTLEKIDNETFQIACEIKRLITFSNENYDLISYSEINNLLINEINKLKDQQNKLSVILKPLFDIINSENNLIELCNLLLENLINEKSIEIYNDECILLLAKIEYILDNEFKEYKNLSNIDILNSLIILSENKK